MAINVYPHSSTRRYTWTCFHVCVSMRACCQAGRRMSLDAPHMRQQGFEVGHQGRELLSGDDLVDWDVGVHTGAFRKGLDGDWEVP